MIFMSGTFVMMHGMTGTSAKMLPLARQLVPEGWDIICPEAKIPHPSSGGYAWWLRSDNPTEPLDDESLSQDNTITQKLISHAMTIIPDGHILWTHVTSPFVGSKIYDEVIKKYQSVIQVLSRLFRQNTFFRHGSNKNGNFCSHFCWNHVGKMDFVRRALQSQA